MKKQNFSLLELLIVIAVLAILTALMIPKFTDIEEDAKASVDNYNIIQTMKMINDFHSANGKYPARLHTGMCDNGSALVNTVDGTDANGFGIETGTVAMKGALAYNMTNATATLPADGPNGKYRESLAKAGIAFLCQGYNRGFTDRTKDATRTDPRYLTGEWYKGQSDAQFNPAFLDTSSAIRVRGQTLGEWTAWSKTPGDFYLIVPLFVTRMTEWKNVYDENGQILKESKLGIGVPAKTPYGDKEAFSFYTALFLAYKDGSPAVLLSLISAAGECVEASSY